MRNYQDIVNIDFHLLHEFYLEDQIIILPVGFNYLPKTAGCSLWNLLHFNECPLQLWLVLSKNTIVYSFLFKEFRMRFKLFHFIKIRGIGFTYHFIFRAGRLLIRKDIDSD